MSLLLTCKSCLAQESEACTDRGTREGYVRTGWDRLRFGLLVACSSRHVGNPYEVKTVPHFSTTDRSYVPSRAIFMLVTVRMTVLCYLVFDILSSFGGGPENNVLLFSPETFPLLRRLRRLSGQQMLVRVISSFTF